MLIVIFRYFARLDKFGNTLDNNGVRRNHFQAENLHIFGITANSLSFDNNIYFRSHKDMALYAVALQRSLNKLFTILKFKRLLLFKHYFTIWLRNSKALKVGDFAVQHVEDQAIFHFNANVAANFKNEVAKLHAKYQVQIILVVFFMF